MSDYTPQTWHDLPTQDTPISAARLTVIEDGLRDHTHSGTSAPPQDEYAKWARSGTVDPDSGSFTFVTDQTETDTHGVIVVDDSTEWVDLYGYPVPEVLETGLYQIISQSRIDPPGAGEWISVGAAIATIDSDGNNFDWYQPSPASLVITVDPATIIPVATATSTVLLPANAHIDLAPAFHGTAPVLASIAQSLLIRRVG